MITYGHYLIDPLMRDLVLDLDKAGYDVMACCQGKTQLRQFKMRRGDECSHDPQAYMGFYDVIPLYIRRKLKKMGVYIYGENTCIAAVRLVNVYKPSEADENHLVPHWKWRYKHLVIKSNKTFAKKVRIAFGV